MLSFLFAIIGIYLMGASLYMLFWAIAAKRKRSFWDGRLRKKNPKNHSIGVFIPAYKEDAVILEVAEQALQQSYQNYQVIVIADSLKEETLTQLSNLPITLVSVTFKESTKVKALQHAMNTIEEIFDLAVVLDADNVMEQDFLVKMNNAYSQGFSVVQGRRVAKNKESAYAILDAMSEAINYNIYNLGPQKLGFSTRLVGSAMAIEYTIFKQLINESSAVGGFDKELELRLLEMDYYLYYQPDAIVWDEKVREGKVFAKQRRRWLAAQYHYLRLYAKPAFAKLIKNQNVDFFNKICQMALPPRLLLPCLLLLGAMATFYLGNWTWGIWAIGLLANVLANAIAIPRTMLNLQLAKALLKLPEAIFLMIIALLGIRGANKKFYHTPHQ